MGTCSCFVLTSLQHESKMALTTSILGSPTRGMVRVCQSERFQHLSSFRFVSSGSERQGRGLTGPSARARKITYHDDNKWQRSHTFNSPIQSLNTFESAVDKFKRLEHLRVAFTDVKVSLDEAEHLKNESEDIQEISGYSNADSSSDNTSETESKMSNSGLVECLNEKNLCLSRKDFGRKGDKFKRFNNLRSSFKKMKSSANASNVPAPSEKSEIFSPVKSKGAQSSQKLDAILSPFKKRITDNDDFLSPLKRKDEPELKIRLIDENSDLSDIVKDATTMSGFSSSILAKYRRQRMSLMFEDRSMEHVDLCSDFVTSWPSSDSERGIN